MTARDSLNIAPRLPAFIFLNGPSGVGKTTLANHLCSLDAGITSYHHASPLWAMLDQLQPNFSDAPLDFESQDTKASLIPWFEDSPHPARNYRDALIDLGNFVRQTFGRETLGQLAVASAEQFLQSYETVVFPGARTMDDIRPLIQAAGVFNCILLRISRPDHSWGTDVGEYLTPAIPSVDLLNDSSEDMFLSRALHAIGISA